MQTRERQIWDLWVPDIGSQGLSFARGRLNATDVLLVHAAPEKLDVEVRSDDGLLLAKGTNLARTIQSPMTRLRRQGGKITREDLWPTEADYGLLVMVAGGEVGVLQTWWNDADQQQWRWSLEFSNHR